MQKLLLFNTSLPQQSNTFAVAVLYDRMEKSSIFMVTQILGILEFLLKKHK